MEHTQRYSQLSDWLTVAEITRHARAEPENDQGTEVLRLLQELLNAVEIMSIDEREAMMSILNGWILAEKFEAARYPVLFGLQRFCISVCLEENPHWRPVRVR